MSKVASHITAEEVKGHIEVFCYRRFAGRYFPQKACFQLINR